VFRRSIERNVRLFAISHCTAPIHNKALLEVTREEQTI
jgi:hypothetical protein